MIQVFNSIQVFQNECVIVRNITNTYLGRHHTMNHFLLQLFLHSQLSFHKQTLPNLHKRVPHPDLYNSGVKIMIRISGSGPRDQDLRIRISGSGSRNQDLGIRISGWGLKNKILKRKRKKLWIKNENNIKELQKMKNLYLISTFV